MGTIVRVPLSGRRVRGWIVEVSGDRPGKLKDIAAISGDMPVFGAELLQTLDWAAKHYVAPLAVMLGKATPPNLPGSGVAVTEVPRVPREPGHPMAGMVSSATDGRRRPTQAMIGNWQALDWLGSLQPLVASGKSALVIVATAAEVDKVRAAAEPLYRGALIDVSGEDDASITSAWVAAQSPGRLVVGTPRTSLWAISSLALVVVLEEGRRAMKERQTPTLHVREVIRHRSLLEAFGVVFFGPTPSVEVLAAGAEVTRIANRAWPLVEIVDRSQEPPGSGLVAEATVAALRAVSARGERCFVFTFRKMVEPCVNEINARLGTPAAGAHPSERLITVGTERDLSAISELGLVVAVNVDGLLMTPGFRASEEALRQLARLANTLSRAPRHRMIAQVLDPSLPIVETLKRGDPIPYLERVLIERGRVGAPPATEVIAVEIRDVVPEEADGQLRAIGESEVLGPLALDNGRRWLLQGDLAEARARLRELVGRWRDGGSAVRVDSDPIDL